MGKDQAMLGLAIAFAIAACSNQVQITPEPTGTTSKSTTTSNTVGSSSSSSGTVTTSGSGGATTSSGGPPVAKAVTADNDMAQYQSIKVPNNPSGGVKVVDGPFFVTDVYAMGNGGFQGSFTTVSGGDCSVPPDQHTWALGVYAPYGSQVSQIHGIRFPVLAGQSLCTPPGQAVGATYDVRGFRPY